MGRGKVWSGYVRDELGHVERGEEEGAAAKRPKLQSGQVTKMAGSYKEEPLWGKGNPVPGLEVQGRGLRMPAILCNR